MSNVKQDIQTTQAQLDAGALTEGAADFVPRGDETTPTKTDPMAARKAMFLKADALRNHETALGEGNETDPDRLAAMLEEARGGREPDDGRARRDVAPTAGQLGDGYVTIPVEGGQIRVSQSDIDREGSVDLYLQRRQRDDAEANSQMEIDTLRRQLAESNRLREEQQVRLAGLDDPANRSASPADRGHNGSGASETELAALASSLAHKIYSGDEDDAQAAILEILKQQRNQSLSAEEIEARVRAEITKSVPAAAAIAAAVPVNPRLKAINAQIDDMAIREYPGICNDDVARTATFAYFKQLVALPENRDRRAVDVARDACDWGTKKFLGDPRSKIIEQKRGLPSSTVASGASSSATEDEAMTPAQVVAMQQNHRNFGRRITP